MMNTKKNTTNEIETYENENEIEQALIAARDAIRLSRMARYKAADVVYNVTGDDGHED